MRNINADLYRLVLVNQIMNMGDDEVINRAYESGVQNYERPLNVLVYFENDTSDTGAVMTNTNIKKFKYILSCLTEVAAYMEEDDES